jgi:hypothetical protein
MARKRQPSSPRRYEFRPGGGPAARSAPEPEEESTKQETLHLNKDRTEAATSGMGEISTKAQSLVASRTAPQAVEPVGLDVSDRYVTVNSPDMPANIGSNSDVARNTGSDISIDDAIGEAIQSPNNRHSEEGNARTNTGTVTATIASADDAKHYEAFSAADPVLVRQSLFSSVPTPIRRRNFFTDTPDKGLFIAFAVLGFTGIMIAKATGLNGIGPAICSVAVLIAYAVISYRVEWFRLHPDRLGDNCYYMGFLFTLASLSAALIAVENRPTALRGELIEALIGNFGVALFSTVAGIALRVMFMQMRREVEDLEEQIRNDLQQAAALLKDQLGMAVIDLESFRVRTQQVLIEQLNSAAEGFASGTGQMARHISAAADAYGQATFQLANDSAKVVTEVGRLIERIDKIDVPADLLTRQVDDARARIQALVGALEASAVAEARRQESFGQAVASLDILLTRLSNIAPYESIAVSARQLGVALEHSGDKLTSLHQQLENHSAAVSRMVSQVEHDATAVSGARQSIQADLFASVASVRQLQEALTDVATGLATRLGGS